MALFDFLKRKKQVEKAKEKQSGKRVEKVLDKKIEGKARPVKSSEVGVLPKAKQFNRVKNFSYDVIKEPHISEKSTYLGEKNKYIFKVYSDTNKPEVKKAVEGIYGVDVLSVNVINIPKKKRRLGRTEGFKKGYRKAVVTIKEGQKIEIL